MSMDAEVSAKFLTAFQNDDDENDNNNKINYFNNQLRVYMNKLQSYWNDKFLRKTQKLQTTLHIHSNFFS